GLIGGDDRLVEEEGSIKWTSSQVGVILESADAETEVYVRKSGLDLVDNGLELRNHGRGGAGKTSGIVEEEKDIGIGHEASVRGKVQTHGHRAGLAIIQL